MICLFNLPFLLNVVTVIFLLFIMVESFLFTMIICSLAAMLLVSMFFYFMGWFSFYLKYGNCLFYLHPLLFCLFR